jgi:flagellar basal body-associated protein FliL
MLLQQKEPLRDESADHSLSALKDPALSSRSLAIAMVVAAVFLSIAIGVVVWLFITPRNAVPTVANQATDDVRDVKNVSLVEPADLPASYAKSDQSKNDQVQVYYYDDATNCGFTVGVGDATEGKKAKDTVTEAITTAQAQGITTTGQNDGDTYELHDADNADKTYDFASVNLDQDVKVDGVAFTKQNNAILYKQLGSKIASLSYACKAETWTDKKAELATLATKFTVKTER